MKISERLKGYDRASGKKFKLDYGVYLYNRGFDKSKIVITIPNKYTIIEKSFGCLINLEVNNCEAGIIVASDDNDFSDTITGNLKHRVIECSLNIKDLYEDQFGNSIILLRKISYKLNKTN